MSERLITEGIVIRSRQYGDYDQIITVFTQKGGKRTFFVRGAKKPKSRLRAGVQLFSHTSFQVLPKKSMDLVVQAVPIRVFEEIRGDLDRLSGASYLAETTDFLIPENEPDEDFYNTLLWVFYRLSMDDRDSLLRFFEVRLLRYLGYGMGLGSCAVCGSRDDDGSFFSCSAGGFICSRCCSQYGDAFPVSGEVRQIIRNINLKSYEHYRKIKPSANAAREMAVLTGSYIESIAGRKVKSRMFL